MTDAPIAPASTSDVSSADAPLNVLRIPMSGDKELPIQITVEGGMHPFLCESFNLSVVEDAPPFLRLQAEDQDLAFHLLDPFVVLEEYSPELFDEDDVQLDFKAPSETLLLAVVNLNRDEQATVNLAAPLAINLRTGRAKQVILKNAQVYGVRHPLSEPAE